MVAIVIGLLVAVVWLSFIEGLPGTPTARYNLSNYVRVYADSFVVTALSNTLVFAVTTTGVGLFFGVAIAWLVERTDLPGKAAVYVIMSLGLLIPTFFLAMGWLFLLHPRIGVLNLWFTQLTGIAELPLSVQTAVGMGFVQGLSITSLAFILTAASFRAMDPALEEAASVHGAKLTQTLSRVVLPLAFPGVLASALYIFTIAIGSFDVPAILGLGNRVFTFSTYIYSLTSDRSISQYGVVGSVSVLMVAIALGLSFIYGNVLKKATRYQVVTGKGYRPNQIPLRRWTLPAWGFIATWVLLAKLLPLLLLIWASLQPFFQPPSLEAFATASLANYASIPWRVMETAAWHSLFFIFTTPTIAFIICFAFSWMVVRSRSPFRTQLDTFAFLPHAVPEIIFGVGAAFLALFVLKGIPLYGSLTLLLICYVVTRLSFGTRLLNSALIQIHHELEEAAAMSGATGMRIALNVLVPLIWPALLNGWLWTALIVSRELTLATLLTSPDNITLPVVVWSMWFTGKLGVASAISVVILIALVPLAIAYWSLGRRGAPGFRPAG